MKKILLLVAALAAWFAPLQAAQDNSSKRTALVERLKAAEIVLQEFQLRPETAIPAEIWRQAKAVIIVKQFKAGFLFGFKGGHGILLVKKPNGRWSLPVMLNATEASLGLQVGATTVDSIYIITDENLPRMLFDRRINFGVDAKAVAGPVASETERTDKPILTAPVLIYSRNLGLYAGATVKAAQLSKDEGSNAILHNTSYKMPELLYSDWVAASPEAQSLMTLIQRLAP